MSRKKKGQSTLEYIIIFAAVLAAIVAFATVVLRPNVERSMNHVANEMETVVDRIQY